MIPWLLKQLPEVMPVTREPVKNCCVALLLARRHDHNHLASFHCRFLLDNCILFKIFLNTLQKLETEFTVRMLTSAETHGDLRFVSRLEKLDQVAQFDLVITLVSCGTKLDLLDVDDLLLLLRRLLLLLLFEDVLAVIHNAAHGWFRIWLYLDKVE